MVQKEFYNALMQEFANFYKISAVVNYNPKDCVIIRIQVRKMLTLWFKISDRK